MSISIQLIKHDEKLAQQYYIGVYVEMYLSLADRGMAEAYTMAKEGCNGSQLSIGVIDCLNQMLLADVNTFDEELELKHAIAFAANADLDDDSIATFLQFGKAGEAMGTIEVPNKQKEAPRFYSATGYGSKIPCDTMVQYLGYWRRVYAACWSNCATHYVIIKGEKITVSFY